MQFLVLGMHRSGTSALTRVLNLMGCYLGSEQELTPGDSSNPKGYFERKDAWALHERVLELSRASWHDVGALDALRLPREAEQAFERGLGPILARLEPHRPWAVKDPRASLLLPLWRARLERPVCVLLHRDPLEVARSLSQRDGFPLAAGLALWERYTHDALLYSRGLPRVLVSYAALLRDPPATVNGLLADLRAQGAAAGLSLPAEGELRAFLDPSLHRQRARASEALEHLNASQRALLERLERREPLADSEPPELSRTGREALDELARAERKRQAALELLEGMIREKDRYVLSLQARVAEQEQQLRELSSGPAEDVPADWSGYAACTIVSRNYLSLARTCCRSFLEQHPGAQAFVLIVDQLDGLLLDGERFSVLSADALGIPAFADFAFKYNILELNTAVKPYLLQRLFERPEVEQLIYLDPDIQVFAPFVELRQALASHQIALTPHALTPLPSDGRRPSETDFLGSGAYNLGFIALRRTPEVRRLLSWWQARLYDGAFSDPAQGLFTDQKWMDLVPSFFSGVKVLRERGYNVAYWNLHERGDLRRSADGRLTLGGTPLRFVHFSGYDKRQPAHVSKHQDRFQVADLSREYRELFAAYAAALDANGWEQTHALPYAYARFDNGARIPDLARRLFFRLGGERQRFGDPFAAAGEGSYFHWLTRPARGGGLLSPLLLGLRELRPDLQRAFPEPEGRHLLPYLAWICEHAGSDFGLGSPYTDSFHEALEQARRQPGASAPGGVESEPELLAEPSAHSAGPAHEGPARTRLKRIGSALLGEERYRALRRELVWPAYTWLRGKRQPARVQVQAGPLPFGVNLLGYFDTESGVGEVARGLAAMLRAAEVPHVLINVEQQWLGRGDRRVRDFAGACRYAVNLLAVNADQVPQVAALHGLDRGRHRHNVGYWFWELSHFPARFDEAFAWVDEVWVASDFCRAAIAERGLRPVHKLVPAVTARPAGHKARGAFGLSDDEFVFLYVFDSASGVKRKNPGAAIAAFRRAFSPDEPARLLLKTVNASPRQLRAYSRLAGPARVRVLDGYLPHGEVLDLIAAADAYVSLHRGEGFGLTLLDALLCDKPVIATPYGGVTEFFAGPGAYPVAYREVPLRRDHGPYPRGARWADPDPADAARQMRAVFEAWRDPARRPPSAGPALRERYGAPAAVPALVARLEQIRLLLA